MPLIPDDLRDRWARWLYRANNLVLTPSDPWWTEASAIAQMAAAVGLADRLIADTTANDRQRPAIYVDHFVSTDVNAVAGRLPDGWPEGFFILLSTGCWLRQFQLFSSLLSLPSFATHIGDAALETEPNVDLTTVDALTTPLTRIIGRSREPADVVRQRAADLLVSASLEFVILHELGHIRNGHLRLSSEAHALTEVAPFERGNLRSQTLEMDADSHATVHLMNRQMMFSLKLQEARAGGTRDMSSVDGMALEALYGTAESALATYLLATYVAFRFMGPAAWEGPFVWSWNHPPAIVRLLGTLEVSNENLKRTRHEAIAALAGQQLGRAAATTAIDVELGLATLYGYTIDPVAVLEPSVAAVGEYNRVLGAEWRSLRPELERLTLGGNLAPG